MATLLFFLGFLVVVAVAVFTARRARGQARPGRQEAGREHNSDGFTTATGLGIDWQDTGTHDHGSPGGHHHGGWSGGDWGGGDWGGSGGGDGGSSGGN
jgi:hypothetical protein